MILILFGLPIGLAIRDFASPFGFDNRVLVVASICFAFILLLGPFWPNERNLQRLDNFFDRHPKLNALICFFTITVTGFSMSWLAMHGSFQSSRRLSNRIIYDALGPFGMASIGVFIGVIGIVGILNALKKQS